MRIRREIEKRIKYIANRILDSTIDNFENNSRDSQTIDKKNSVATNFKSLKEKKFDFELKLRLYTLRIIAKKLTLLTRLQLQRLQRRRRLKHLQNSIYDLFDSKKNQQ